MLYRILSPFLESSNNTTFLLVEIYKDILIKSESIILNKEKIIIHLKESLVISMF